MPANVPNAIRPGARSGDRPQEDWLAALLPEASVLAGSRDGSSKLAQLASQLPGGAAVAIPIAAAGPRRRERASLPLRAARGMRLVAAAAWMRVLAARAGARLRAAGLRSERVDVGRPEDGHPVGLRGRRLRLAPSALVVGYSEPAAPAPLEVAIEAAAEALGAPLEVEGARVLASGVLMIEVRSSEGGYLLRIAGPATADSLAGAEQNLTRLLACDPPGPVRERLVAAVGRGSAGGMRWSLEPRRAGTHPAVVSEGQWESCLDFLVALRSTARPADAHAEATLAADCQVLEKHLEPAARRLLAALEPRLEAQLGELARGWGHGDFHPGNLLAERDRLTTVLDWDAAGPATLPLLDVLHLTATAAPARRRLGHGLRCSAVLWPLAAAGGDPRIRAYCEATATPSDPATLLALAQGYWLTRVARDLREFADRAGREEWLELNLRRPLAELRS